MPTIFVNYRRQDSDAYAGRLYDTLAVRLPDLVIFMDVDTLKGGDDFTQVLKKNLSIDRCNAGCYWPDMDQRE